MSDQNEAVLFEIAWEVCRKVGGIYTVLRSKAPTMVERWGERYCLIGPYDGHAAALEFEALEAGDILAPTLAALRERGLGCHFGRWLISGYPKAVLLDLQPGYTRLEECKRRLWDEHRIATPPNDPETNDAVAFGYVVTELLAEHCRQHPDRRTVAHFHEWMASAALPNVQRQRLSVATVFTTHATLLGRYLCATRSDFYERLPWLDPDAEAGSLNIYHRYCIERAAAHTADVFTTVSDVTAIEAQHLIKRQPEVILPNGLQVEKFAALHEFQNLHARSKERIHQFVRGHFFGSDSFALENTLYFFIAGRYEYRNKGIDLFIEALHQLNNHLKQAGSDRTVVAFLIAPAATKSINVDVLNNQVMLGELHKLCDEITRGAGRRLFDVAATGQLPEPQGLLSDQDIIRLKRMLLTRRRTTNAQIVTHNMTYDNEDPILQHLRHRRLFNTPQDRVKVVYHPAFLTGTNPLLGAEYDEFVRGCHLGVFPSYYEPWGYTPAECTLLGVPSVTSNLSGFGAFIASEVPDHARRGVYVVDRRHQDAGRSIDELAQILIDFCRLTRRQRIELRNRTERLSDLLDWSNLAQAYTQAHELAIARTYESHQSENERAEAG